MDDLSLEVHQGEVFGLLGPNGSGKTTTIRILNGIIKPTSGNVFVNGFDIRTHVDDVKRSTGLLAETPGAYEKLSPIEYLEFIGSLYDVKKELLPDRIDKLLNLFDLQDRSDDLIEGFSKGMRQKVLIAAALIHDPPIIFLDEPTSALDPRSSMVVRDLITDLSVKAKKTVFVSSHILPMMEEVCDRMGIINKGRLVALGTVKEISESTGSANLEEAFIALTGGESRPDLLAWRSSVADA
ncbi:MAG: Trehalose/maltose import ATP-binding protein MalK [Methanomassiliicoccales archaeon PtaU1.Bin124]|nr:MAG: Trehalose/maltose import ATP-binding protein MalK [Methanomassiliicoccales archaeon PtaU1.Bin124]